jgi:LAO/AO transport system kinase
MVDFFLLLQLAGGGDELQGIKRGIIEIADMIAITKADGDNLPAAIKAVATFEGALAILRPGTDDWIAPVLAVSAHTNRGLDELWAMIVAHRERMTRSGAFAARRRAQAAAWMHELLRERLLALLTANAAVARRMGELEDDVVAGRRTPALAVAELMGMMGLSPG